MAILKKGSRNFRLVGKPVITDSSLGINQVSGTGSGFVSNRLDLGINCGDNNIVTARMFDGYYPGKRVYLHGKTTNAYGKEISDYKAQFNVDWNERMAPDTIAKAGPDCFIEIGLDKTANGINVKKFISAYDAIQYIYEFVRSITNEGFNNLVLDVRGEIEYGLYQKADAQGNEYWNVSTKRNIKSIMIVDSNSEFKNTYNQTVYFNSDCFEDVPDETIGLTTMHTYVPEYITKVNSLEIKKTIPVKYDFAVPSHIVTTLKNVLVNNEGYARATFTGAWSEISLTTSLDENEMSADQLEAFKYMSDEDIAAYKAASGESSAHKRFAEITGIRPVWIDGKPNIDIKNMVQINAYTLNEINDMYVDYTSKLNGSTAAPTTSAKTTSATDTVSSVDSSDDDLPFDMDAIIGSI